MDAILERILRQLSQGHDTVILNREDAEKLAEFLKEKWPSSKSTP